MALTLTNTMPAFAPCPNSTDQSGNRWQVQIGQQAADLQLLVGIRNWQCTLLALKFACINSLQIVTDQIDQSVGCVCVSVDLCVWTITFELSDLWSTYFTRWYYILTLSRPRYVLKSRSQVKVHGHRKKTKVQQVQVWPTVVEKQTKIGNCKQVTVSRKFNPYDRLNLFW